MREPGRRAGANTVGRRFTRRLAVAVLWAVVAVTATAPAAVGAGEYALPSDVSPSVERAPVDRERVWSDGCLAWDARVKPRSCVYGNKYGSYTLALVGDSHASHFFPAFEAVAKKNGWRLVTFLKINCPFVDIPVYHVYLEREYTECATWNSNVVNRLNNIRPDLMVVAQYRIYPLRWADRTVERKAAALARMIGRVRSPAMILADSTVSRVDVPACLDQNRSDIRPCATRKKYAYRGHAVIEREAASMAGVPMIDLAGRICVALPCPAVVNNMIPFRDNHHLTATFARSLGRPLERQIKSLR